jgi:hypothetical protein
VVRFSAIVLLLVVSVLVAEQSAPKVRAVLEPVVIVAGILMVLSATANRRLRRVRRDS